MNGIAVTLIGVALEGAISVYRILTADQLLTLRTEEETSKGFDVLDPHDVRLITNCYEEKVKLIERLVIDVLSSKVVSVIIVVMVYCYVNLEVLAKSINFCGNVKAWIVSKYLFSNSTLRTRSDVIKLQEIPTSMLESLTVANVAATEESI